ncbi:hypothetical protein AVEN_83804-1 [Araneus ventricosus]|uniref:Uncharacterized protein n=1 Tax=Araneus ventricosus TaxID=182803 RepID=A0A4Y2X7Z5_ARAVE|nr:hypothetical protein AVEN_83804-1 [Araneus ventricosus]
MLQISVLQVPKTVRSQVERGSFYWSQHKKTVIRFPFLRNNGDKIKEAWCSFKYVMHRVLGNIKNPLYKTIVQRMLTAYEAQGCKMSLKVHFLLSHINCFLENLGDSSEEQGERFHQDVRDIERRYQGRWDVNMLADYCWMLRPETEDGNLKRVRRRV